MGPRIHLRNLLVVAAGTAFVTLLIAFTEDLRVLWPLYGLPIVIAALTYYLSGAVVMTALVAAALAFLVTDGGLAATPGLVTELTIGVAMFGLSGLVIGGYARRREQQRMSLERATVRDPLTGLYSPDYFASRLDEELSRAERYDVGVGLILLDLDRFRDFNETFGTHRGDLLLAHLAEILSISIRDTDILAHYAGGEYALILPFADVGEARGVAERLRLIVEEADFEGDELEPVTKHTVSVGVSAFPEPAPERDSLLAMAARSLDAAKLGGRNRVEVVTELPAAEPEAPAGEPSADTP
jgi:diguanylate cyclase (GGDEF)-like protein